MFGLSIVDHVRLNLARTTENYTVHARAAERLARLTTRLRISVLALSLVAAVASIVSLIELGPSPSFRIATVVATTVAFAACAGYVAFGFEGRVHAHRLCAHKLWLVCERHRALLATFETGPSIGPPSCVGATSSLWRRTARTISRFHLTSADTKASDKRPTARTALMWTKATRRPNRGRYRSPDEVPALLRGKIAADCVRLYPHGPVNAIAARSAGARCQSASSSITCTSEPSVRIGSLTGRAQRERLRLRNTPAAGRCRHRPVCRRKPQPADRTRYRIQSP